MIRRRSAALVLTVLAAALAGCATTAAPASRFLATGPARPLPTEVLAPVTGDEFESMLVALRGKVVVVNIWASWCAPCRTEAPLLERAASASGPDVVFLGVASKDERSAALDFLDEFDITYPNVLDSTGAIRERLGLRGFPTTYIVGRDGRVRTTVIGGISEQRLAAQLEDALRA